jgi:hypothetical protein
MAVTSNRQSNLFGINYWQQIYQTYAGADFTSYNYETLRKSFIDYLQIYYPETFNDYIESSEFIALLDVMAFMGQGLAFRNDLNARENFIDTAERRDSVVKLANLVSYTPQRNLAGQGYLKVISIQTTQNITDINGLNLSNVPILWNDPANPSWQDQFNTIINATLINSQFVGRPGNSQDILGTTTSEYSINIPPLSLPIVPFNATINGQSSAFELTSMTSVGEDYLYEIPPAPSGKFNILYRNDQLGYGSPNTGWFFYFKQGTLQNYTFNLAQQIANQVINIGNIQGVNNTDTWLYQLTTNNASPSLWKQVENVYANAYLQSVAEGSQRAIFSVTSGFNDTVSYVFGDGVFSEIPVGNFLAYVRAGNALTYTIYPSDMQGITIAFSYVTRLGTTETLTVTLELQETVSNAQARETIADIKQRAPAGYYTQNRMVNGQDYNNFPYSYYSSIIKSQAINRSSIGISKNIDLLDSTGKYSSTNSFGNDGALYQDNTPGFLTLTINSNSDILVFLTSTLSAALASNNANQYYVQYYPRYPINATTTPGTILWQTSSVDASSESGYFYYVSGDQNIPVQLGTYSTTNLQYITQGALLYFTAPTGYYFDGNNRLVAGIPGPTDITGFWTTVLNVIGDGSNNGLGSFSNGTGPVVLNSYVPSNAILTTVIPTFGNSLPTDVIQEATIKLQLQLSFSLVFNNAIPINQERWSISYYGDPNAFVNFSATGTTGANIYTITYNQLTYYFGSAADTRFAPPSGTIVYDPFSGKILQDFINILPVNTLPNSSYPLSVPVKVNIVGQTVEPDGYTDDFQVEVSATDVNDKQLILNPDFFNFVTGYVQGSTNTGIYVFFEKITDALNLTRYQIIPSTDVAYMNLPTVTQIELVKYDYPLGQLFYAYSDNVFYTTVQNPSVTTPDYVLVVQPQYSIKTGRQGLSFQYRHNSNNTTRIDPTTTNIIDLYIVTQSYYTQYQNYIQDTTGTIPEPDMPTIDELNQDYGQLQDYKMVSDSLIPNSVVFKPLFGPKADPALQATIKIVPVAGVNASNSEIISSVLSAMNDYFDINNWNFGDTFYFSELAAYLHTNVGEYVSSAVLVANNPNQPFGSLYEIQCAPYEIFVNAATANNIVVIPALTPAELQIAL